MTTGHLAELYLKTVVSIEENSRFIPASSSGLVRTSVVHVLTGWNPGDDRPTRDQNDSANRRLHMLLEERGLQPVRAIGADPDSDHAEESWAVVGLDDEEARAIGASFGQVAVFRISDGTQTVLACSEDWTLSRPL